MVCVASGDGCVQYSILGLVSWEDGMIQGVLSLLIAVISEIFREVVHNSDLGDLVNLGIQIVTNIIFVLIAVSFEVYNARNA